LVRKRKVWPVAARPKFPHRLVNVLVQVTATGCEPRELRGCPAECGLQRVRIRSRRAGGRHADASPPRLAWRTSARRPTRALALRQVIPEFSDKQRCNGSRHQGIMFDGQEPQCPPGKPGACMTVARCRNPVRSSEAQQPGISNRRFPEVVEVTTSEPSRNFNARCRTQPKAVCGLSQPAERQDSRTSRVRSRSPAIQTRQRHTPTDPAHDQSPVFVDIVEPAMTAMTDIVRR
jgi:hypothetical protein